MSPPRPLLTAALVSACAPHTSEAPAVERAPAVEPEPPAVAPPPPLPEKPPTTTTWSSLEVAPGCTLQIADTPAALGPPLTWRPCEGPGCVESTLDGYGGWIAGVARGADVTIAASFSLPGPRLRHVLAPREGLPFVALEGPRDESCSLAGASLTADGGAIEVSFDHADGYASRAYLRGPLQADAAWTRIAAVLPRREFPEFIGESVFSAGGRVVVEQNGGPLRWYDDAARRWIEIPGSRGGWECCAEGHADVITFMLSSIPEQAKIVRLGEAARPLFREPLGGVSPVALAGRRAAWVRGFDRDQNNYYKRVELWTGELSDRLEIEGAARLAVLPHRTMVSPWLGATAAVVPGEERGGSLQVYRLDGAGVATLKPPAGRTLERVLWVSADELAVQVGAGDAHVEPPQVRRHALASLPASG